MPAGSETDRLLAKAEQTTVGAPLWQHIQEGKKTCSRIERGVRICERNKSADTKVSEEGGGGGAPGVGAQIPLQPMEKTMVRQAVSLQPMEVHSGADIHL